MASADIEFIKEGGKLAMYLQSGKFKHDRWFWLEGDHLSWDKKKKAPGKANKSEPLAGAKDAPAIKSAQEWFKMIDADGSGAIDEEEFATLYKKARRAPPCRARAIPACPALCARWGTSVWA